MKERNDVVKMRGEPLTLLGDEVKVGDMAPDFAALDADFEPVKLSSFRGKVVVIVAVPSIDTAVCDVETRRFNQEAGKFGDDVVVLGVSMDLPTAQKRWCAFTGVKRVKMLSDHHDASFGTSFGVLIKELRLLARTIFIIDRDGRIAYIQYATETAHEPKYDEVLKALKKVTEG
ncbi:MAG: thiol peroxidase [Candidatus Zixiibacteriota bacterium]|nr:MAG: thiol peroxidase [candidate division Zixibacteria bacterium]